MAITDWPADERPREKLLQHGAARLSDAELIAIFLRVGVKGKSAVDLGRDLIRHFGSLTRLFRASEAELSAIHGMGQAKFVQLQAVLEMAKRALAEDMHDLDAASSPQAVQQYLQLWLAGRQQELFVGLFLNAQNQVLAAEVLAEGTLNQAAVYPREVLKRALHHHAAAMIVAHNHPSGTLTPSQADIAFTTRLKEALAFVDVRLLDHVIIGGNRAYSFVEHGQLF